MYAKTLWTKEHEKYDKLSFFLLFLTNLVIGSYMGSYLVLGWLMGLFLKQHLCNFKLSFDQSSIYCAGCENLFHTC